LEVSYRAKLGARVGFGPMRVMTDVSAEAMKGYHDLIVEGRREIYQIEKT
jgi:hypothetical protein